MSHNQRTKSTPKGLICYLHGVDDANEVHFDPGKHMVCVDCGIKLWELAQRKMTFEMRGDIVLVDAVPEELFDPRAWEDSKPLRRKKAGKSKTPSGVVP